MILYALLTIYLTLNVFFYGTWVWTSGKDIHSSWQLFGMACLFTLVGTFIFITGYVSTVIEEYLKRKEL